MTVTTLEGLTFAPIKGLVLSNAGDWPTYAPQMPPLFNGGSVWLFDLVHLECEYPLKGFTVGHTLIVKGVPFLR